MDALLEMPPRDLAIFLTLVFGPPIVVLACALIRTYFRSDACHHHPTPSLQDLDAEAILSHVRRQIEADFERIA